VVLKIARFVNPFLVALLAGLLVGVLLVELALLEVSASVYTAVEKPKLEVFAPIMPIFNTLVIVVGCAGCLGRREPPPVSAHAVARRHRAARVRADRAREDGGVGACRGGSSGGG
jgi:hypothetical protein